MPAAHVGDFQHVANIFGVDGGRASAPRDMSAAAAESMRAACDSVIAETF